MLRTSVLQCARVYSSAIRNLSAAATSEKLISLDVNDKTGYATLTLNRPPVNGLNLELLTSISEALDEIGNNKSRGMILTSSSKTVFSGGLDITEMYKPNMDRLKLFWTTLQDVWLKLYGSSFPTAAAINGHSPAGGCLLGLSCEYRVIVQNYMIGLNETQLGIVAPTWFQASMRNVLSCREAEQALTLGKMYSSEEALRVGLVDAVVNDKTEAIAHCEKFLDQFKKISPESRGITKQSFRRRDLEELESNRDQDVQLFMFTVNQPKVQKGLEMYMASLKKK